MIKDESYPQVIDRHFKSSCSICSVTANPMLVAWERARYLEKRKARPVRPPEAEPDTQAVTPAPAVSFARCHQSRIRTLFLVYGYRAVGYRHVILDYGHCALVHGHVDGGYEHCAVGYADMKVGYRDFSPEHGH